MMSVMKTRLASVLWGQSIGFAVLIGFAWLETSGQFHISGHAFPHPRFNHALYPCVILVVWALVLALTTWLAAQVRRLDRVLHRRKQSAISSTEPAAQQTRSSSFLARRRSVPSRTNWSFADGRRQQGSSTIARSVKLTGAEARTRFASIAGFL